MSDQSPARRSTDDRAAGVGPHEFRAALGRFATGVCVISAVGGDGMAAGVTVSALASLSLRPPLVLFCLDKATTNLHAFQQSAGFGISVLSEAQIAVSELFASQRPDKFAAVAHRVGANGCRLIEGAAAQLECASFAVHEGGDHLIFIARVEGTALTDEPPLVHFRGAYGRLAVTA